MNGANLECLIPEPKQYRENYSDRRWNIYPVMVALQERHHIGKNNEMSHLKTVLKILRSLSRPRLSVDEDSVVDGVIPKEGLAGSVPVKPSFDVTLTKI